MTAEKTIHFDTLKGAREGYFAEYVPPGGSSPFATINLVFHDAGASADAQDLMIREAQRWTARYPIPVLVFACDEMGAAIRQNSGDSLHLAAWLRSDGTLEQRWDLPADDEFPADALSVEHLLNVYHDVSHKTASEVRDRVLADAKETAKGLRLVKALIFIWFVIVPLAVATLGFASTIIGIVVWIYAWLKAGVLTARIRGWLPKSAREIAKSEKLRKMEHYYYHCERNPGGFARLLGENVDSDSRSEIQRIAEELGSRRDRT